MNNLKFNHLKFISNLKFQIKFGYNFVRRCF